MKPKRIFGYCVDLKTTKCCPKCYGPMEHIEICIIYEYENGSDKQIMCSECYMKDRSRVLRN